MGSVELLIEAVKEKETQIIELLLKKVGLNSKDKSGRTPLHWAALYGHTDIARFFIDKGADVNAKAGDGYKEGFTSLHLAVRSNSTEIVKSLIAAGATVDIQDDRCETSLHKAAIYGHTDTVKELIEAGANVKTYNEYGQTPLHSTAEYGRTELA